MHLSIAFRRLLASLASMKVSFMRHRAIKESSLFELYHVGLGCTTVMKSMV